MRLGGAASAAWKLVFDGSASSAQAGFGIKRKSARRRARRNMMTQEKLLRVQFRWVPFRVSVTVHLIDSSTARTPIVRGWPALLVPCFPAFRTTSRSVVTVARARSSATTAISSRSAQLRQA